MINPNDPIIVNLLTILLALFIYDVISFIVSFFVASLLEIRRFKIRRNFHSAPFREL